MEGPRKSKAHAPKGLCEKEKNLMLSHNKPPRNKYSNEYGKHKLVSMTTA